jgi:hypothetical protein
MRTAESEERILPASFLTTLLPTSHDVQNIGRFIGGAGGAVCLAGLPIAFSLATKSGIAKVYIKMIVCFGEQKANFPEFSCCGVYPFTCESACGWGLTEIEVEEGGKRVFGIMGSILASHQLKTTEDLRDSRPSPSTESLVGSAVQSAERISEKDRRDLREFSG